MEVYERYSQAAVIQQQNNQATVNQARITMLLRWQEIQAQVQQQIYAITEGMDEVQLSGEEQLGVAVNWMEHVYRTMEPVLNRRPQDVTRTPP